MMVQNFITSKEEMDGVISLDTKQIIVFIKSYCPVCKRYVDELMNKYRMNFYLFDVDVNEKFYVKYKMSMFFPETRIYQKNELVYCRGGQLFDTQIQEIRGIINEN